MNLPMTPPPMTSTSTGAAVWDILAASTFMTHTVCERISRQRATEGLCLRGDLQDAHAPHVQEVASLHMRNADERSIAGRAAYYRPHAMYVGGGRTKRIGGAAARTGGLDKRHFKREDRLQGSRGSVAIEFVLHHASPVGPNRSVLTRPGSCPRVTRLAAAVSTNGVGPQINVRGR